MCIRMHVSITYFEVSYSRQNCFQLEDFHFCTKEPISGLHVKVVHTLYQYLQQLFNC